MNDEVGTITIDEMNQQCNIPGNILFYNGDKIAQENQMKGGWFTGESLEESTDLSEGYRGVDPTAVKQVVLFYVLENGYIRGSWNGTYATTSPTVAEINRMIRSGEYDEYLPIEPAAFI